MPSSAKENKSEIDREYYLGFNVDNNNKISEAYVCVTRNEIEYCLKASSSYEINKTIFEEAFKDGSCQFESDGAPTCSANFLYAILDIDGSKVGINGLGEGCFVQRNGSFGCWVDEP